MILRMIYKNRCMSKSIMLTIAVLADMPIATPETSGITSFIVKYANLKCITVAELKFNYGW